MLQAKEFGEAEVWMNERMMRTGGNHVAEFITAFQVRSAFLTAHGQSAPASRQRSALRVQLDGCPFQDAAQPAGRC